MIDAVEKIFFHSDFGNENRRMNNFEFGKNTFFKYKCSYNRIFNWSLMGDSGLLRY